MLTFFPSVCWTGGMSVHLFDGALGGLPAEPHLLAEVTLRLIAGSERERFDEALTTQHYLKNATAVGRVLRYVAQYRGQWLALVVFSSPAFHLKLRDQWLGWSPRQVKERRHLIAQNTRFLVLAAAGQWPNLASRVLKLVCERLPADWQEHFGYPVQVAETFVDPQRFRATCYKAAGWQQLGPTQGYERDWQDFYTDIQHPKQLWVRPLGAGALEQVRGPELPCALADPQGPLPPACPVSTALGLALGMLPGANERSAQTAGSAAQAGWGLGPHRFSGGGGLQRAARDGRICPEPQSGPTAPLALPPTPGSAAPI